LVQMVLLHEYQYESHAEVNQTLVFIELKEKAEAGSCTGLNKLCKRRCDTQ